MYIPLALRRNIDLSPTPRGVSHRYRAAVHPIVDVGQSPVSTAVVPNVDHGFFEMLRKPRAPVVPCALAQSKRALLW